MILVTGATGFVGSHVVRRLRKEGLPVRAIVRTPAKAQVLKDQGVEVVPGDINDLPSLEAAAKGCDTAIHLVGIIQEGRGFTFRSVHVEGTRNVLDAAKAAGVKHFIHQSALGTRDGAVSEYHKTKYEAEKLVRASGIPFTILRPSLIYGPGDQFTLRLADAIKLSPVLPVIGSGRSKVQPVFIDDVASCFVKLAAGGEHLKKTYEIGGPEQLTYEEVTKAIASALGVDRPTMHMPLFLMRNLARAAEIVLPKPPVTTDQLIMLQEDNITAHNDLVDIIGAEPVRFREGLARFMGKR